MRKTDYRPLVTAEAKRRGVDPGLALRVMMAESSGNPNVVSRTGARGLFQLMPQTARGLGVDPDIPEQNIRGGVTYLAQQLKAFGTPERALRAYNAGPGAVDRSYKYPETNAYVRRILGGKDMGIINPRAVVMGGQAKKSPARVARPTLTIGRLTAGPDYESERPLSFSEALALMKAQQAPLPDKPNYAPHLRILRDAEAGAAAHPMPTSLDQALAEAEAERARMGALVEGAPAPYQVAPVEAVAPPSRPLPPGAVRVRPKLDPTTGILAALFGLADKGGAGGYAGNAFGGAVDAAQAEQAQQERERSAAFQRELGLYGQEKERFDLQQAIDAENRRIAEGNQQRTFLGAQAAAGLNADRAGLSARLSGLSALKGQESEAQRAQGPVVAARNQLNDALMLNESDAKDYDRRAKAANDATGAGLDLYKIVSGERTQNKHFDLLRELNNADNSAGNYRANLNFFSDSLNRMQRDAQLDREINMRKQELGLKTKGSAKDPMDTRVAETLRAAREAYNQRLQALTTGTKPISLEEAAKDARLQQLSGLIAKTESYLGIDKALGTNAPDFIYDRSKGALVPGR